MVPAGLTKVQQVAGGNVNSLALVGVGPPITGGQLTGLTFGTNGFSVSFPTRNGRVYRLEYKISLGAAAWQVLPLQAGTGGKLTLTDPAPASPQGFYRVREW
jgi:hypothetical protein